MYPIVWIRLDKFVIKTLLATLLHLLLRISILSLFTKHVHASCRHIKFKYVTSCHICFLEKNTSFFLIPVLNISKLLEHKERKYDVMIRQVCGSIEEYFYHQRSSWKSYILFLWEWSDINCCIYFLTRYICMFLFSISTNM